MKSNNLYFFPALPGKNSGYEWAVKSDMTRLNINDSDYIVFYAPKSAIRKFKPIGLPTQNIYYIARSKRFLRILYCILTFNHPSLFLKIDWNKLPYEIRGKNFNKVFFGDTTFYPVYKLIKHEVTQFRFHNLWSRIKEHSKISVFNFKNYINIKYFSFIERQILKLNATFLFITENDKEFAFVDESVSIYFPINIEVFDEKKPKLMKDYEGKALFWFGSVSTHKYASVNISINIFKKLRKEHYDLIFILYGSGTDKFDDKENGIWGLGFYDEDTSLPITSKCIYLNPDDTGGVIKIKNFDIIKTEKINYLTTPEGFEGCELYLRDGIKVLPITKWYEYLNNYFQ